MPPRLPRPTLVLGLVLCGALVWAGPRVGPEIVLDPVPGAEPLSSFTYEQGAVFTGQDFALAWADLRSGTWALYAATLDVDGGVTQPGTRVLLDVDDGPASFASPSACARNGEVLWAVVEPWAQGGVLTLLRTTPGLARLGLSTWVGVGPTPAVLACEGPEPLVLTHGSLYAPLDMRLVARWLSADGGLRDVDGGAPLVARLQLPPGARPDEAVAFDGARYLVAFVDGRNHVSLPDGGVDDPLDVWGVFLDPVQGASAPFLLAGGPGEQSNPRLAFDGARYLLLWRTASDGGPGDLWARTLDPAGSLDAPVPVATTAGDEGLPALVFDGRRFVLAWGLAYSPTDVELRSTTLEGRAWGPTQTVARSWFDVLRAVTSEDGEVLLVTRDFHRGIRTVGVLVGGAPGDGGVLDPASTAATQTAPLARAGPLGQQVAWMAHGFPFGTRVDPDGGVLRAPRAVWGTARTTQGFTGQGALGLFGWTDGTSSRVDADLVPLDLTAPRWAPPGAAALTNPAWNGDGWSLGAAVPEDGGLGFWLAHLFPDGGGLAPERVGGFDGGSTSVQLADDGQGTTLAVSSPNYRVELSCARPGLPEQRAFLANASYTPWARVATDGRGFLVVYFVDRGSGLVGLDGLLVGPDCQVDVAAHFPIASLPRWLTAPPAVAFDGHRYLVTYTGGADRKGDVLVARVERDAGVAAPILVAADPLVGEGSGSLSVEAPGRWLVTSVRFDGSEAVSARRAVAHWVVDDADGSPCGGDADCASGACRDGVCCEAACPAGACAVCAQALGAVADGVCTPRPRGTTCRASALACDPAETCDGTAWACPADVTDGGCAPLRLAGRCGETLVVPTASGPGPFAASLVDGGALPAGFVIEASTGEARWAVPAGTTGTWAVVLTSPQAQPVEIDVSCDSGRRWAVGCDCGPGGGGAPLAWLLTLALHAARPRRLRS